jgi:hypothetical protein
MPYDPLRPSAACLRAWKHALFNDWTSLDPNVTESDPLPTWFTSLDNRPEMDASEAEIVLAWCLGEDPPVDPEIPERRKLAEIYSLIPPPGQGTPTTVPANNAIDGTPAAAAAAASSSRMQEFPEINSAIVVDIAAGSVSSESAIYTDPVVTPGSSNSISGGGNVDVSNQIQATEDATPTLGQPPLKETKPKPKPSPAPQEPQDSTMSNSTPATSPVGDGNGELLPSPDSGSSSDSSSSDGGNNTKPVKPSPSPKPDKNDPNDTSSTNAGGDDTDSNSSPPSTDSTIDSGNVDNDTQGNNTNDTTDGSEVENPDQENSNTTTPTPDSSNQIDFGNGEEETTTTTTDISNSMYESTDPEDYATPGNYKPVIITPAFTVVNPNVDGAASGGDGAVMADLDAEHLLQAGSGSDSDVVDNETVIATGELATLELDGESVDGETVAVPQVAMSTSSSPPTIFSSSIALLLTTVMLLGM